MPRTLAGPACATRRSRWPDRHVSGRAELRVLDQSLERIHVVSAFPELSHVTVQANTSFTPLDDEQDDAQADVTQAEHQTHH